MKTQAAANTIPRSGRAQRSNTWIRLCPSVATATWATTITRNASQNGTVTFTSSAIAWSANAPLTLLTMNQPKAPVNALSPAGRMLPRNPNGPRLSTIIGTPNLGPQDDTTACVSEPTAVPTMIAVAASQMLRPKRLMAMTPTKTVANSRFGDSHVQNR